MSSQKPGCCIFGLLPKILEDAPGEQLDWVKLRDRLIQSEAQATQEWL